MSSAFGVDLEADLIGALSVPRSFAPRTSDSLLLDHIASDAGALLRRAAALFRDHARRPSRRRAARVAEREIRDAFDRLAEDIGLGAGERTAFFKRADPFSRVVLGLETLDAAFDCFGGPASVADWLRVEGADEVFGGRSPLRAMVEDGPLAVELALLHLRARQRGRAPSPGI
jgi:hypothetical protein